MSAYLPHDNNGRCSGENNVEPVVEIGARINSHARLDRLPVGKIRSVWETH